ncbi:conjugative transfer protein trbB [Vibrio ishigakensis]|uniref:Conjugative transfer protein trbB n=1 Tax=Vibrio ishigakensis TaxID=1481914 RepID=A0A0B8PEX7_9VIBR|nr:conjugative transfer protein trbB [Vibrio ishigakensis]
MGEVRGGEALELLKAWNTGHPGGIATIHADSALKGLSRFEQCLSEVTSHVNQTFIADSVHALVYMSRDPEGTRSIKELLRVDGFNGKEYDTTPLYSKN